MKPECPVCHTALAVPDKPRRRRIAPAGRSVISGVQCPGCLSVIDFFEDTGDCACLQMPRELRVRRSGP